MGWRKDFKEALIDALETIPNIGPVRSKWTKQPIGVPSLRISLTLEEYGRTMKNSVGLIVLGFEIIGKVQDIDDPDEAKEELLDQVIEKLEGITGYNLIIDDTDFHDKEEGGGTMFTLSGHIEEGKDYSAM